MKELSLVERVLKYRGKLTQRLSERKFRGGRYRTPAQQRHDEEINRLISDILEKKLGRSAAFA